ncbi:MAG: hypothetical protein AB1746_06155 [Candidatus Zixiibacteriota bacterium]
MQKWKEQSSIDKLEGEINEDHWLSMNEKWDMEIERLHSNHSANSGDYRLQLTAAREILELSQLLPSLYNKANLEEKSRLPDLLYSNSQLNGRTLYTTYKKPFSFIAKRARTKNKLGDRESSEAPF